MSDSTDDQAEQTGTEEDSSGQHTPLAIPYAIGSRIQALGQRVLPSVVRQNYLLKFGLAIVLVIVLITTVGIGAIVETTDTLDRQVSQQIQSDAEREAAAIERWREQHSRWINGASKTATVQQSDYDAVSIGLQREIESVPGDIRFVHVVATDSMEVLASNSRQQEGSVFDWHGEPLEPQTSDDVMISDVYRDAGIPVVAFGTPISQRPDRLLIAESRVQDPVEQVEEDTNAGFVTVVDDSGQIVMDSRGDQFVGEQYGTDEPVHELVEDGESAFRRTAPNDESLEESHVAGIASVDGAALTVVQHEPESTAYLVQSEVIQSIVVLFFVSLVGLTLIGVAIAGGTVRSINRLAGRVEELEDGNLDVEFETSRIDEIGQLYTGFGQLRDSLQERFEELRESLRREELVRAELAETNEDLQRQQAIISVLNRLLRHNLRNRLTIIRGRGNQLAEDTTAPRADWATEIVDTTDNLLAQIDKTRKIERLVGTDREQLASIDLVRVVESTASDYRQRFPNATITVDTRAEWATVLGESTIPFVLDNLVENAIEHSDREEPTVEITVDRTTMVPNADWKDGLHDVVPTAAGDGLDTTVQQSPEGGADVSKQPTQSQSTADEQVKAVELVVADDGPGIPEQETKVLQAGVETPLEHGSGIGLRLIDWLITFIGGTIEFEDREPRGSRVVVTLPIADAERDR